MEQAAEEGNKQSALTRSDVPPNKSTGPSVSLQPGRSEGNKNTTEKPQKSGALPSEGQQKASGADAQAPAKPAGDGMPRPHAAATKFSPPTAVLPSSIGTGRTAAAWLPQTIGGLQKPTPSGDLSQKKSGIVGTSTTYATCESMNGSRAAIRKGAPPPEEKSPGCHVDDSSNASAPVGLPPGPPKGRELQDQSGMRLGSGGPSAASNQQSIPKSRLASLPAERATPTPGVVIASPPKQIRGGAAGAPSSPSVAKLVADIAQAGNKAVATVAEVKRLGKSEGALLIPVPAAPGGLAVGVTHPATPAVTTAPGAHAGPAARPLSTHGPSAAGQLSGPSSTGPTSQDSGLGQRPPQRGRKRGRPPGRGRGRGRESDAGGSGLGHSVRPQSAFQVPSPASRNPFLKPHQQYMAYNTLSKQISNHKVATAAAQSAAARLESTLGKKHSPGPKPLTSRAPAMTSNAGSTRLGNANRTAVGSMDMGQGMVGAKRVLPPDCAPLHEPETARLRAASPSDRAPGPGRDHTRPAQGAAAKAPASSRASMLAADCSRQAAIRAAAVGTISQPRGSNKTPATDLPTSMASAGSGGRSQVGRGWQSPPQARGRGRHSVPAVECGVGNRTVSRDLAVRGALKIVDPEAADATRKRSLEVAEAALDMPPDQLCSPLVVMALMALSRRAAEQVMEALANPQIPLSTAAHLGASGGDRARRGKGRLSGADAAISSSSLHASMLPSLAGIMDRDNAPKISDCEDMRAHLHSLQMELQEERKRRQLLESSVLEVNESMQMLHAKLVAARAERDAAQEQLARAGNMFEMERRAWEDDSQHMFAASSQSAAHAGRLRSALDSCEAQLESLEQELVQERAVKERAMAFITQRALMAVQEDQEGAPPIRPIAEPMPTHPRHMPRGPPGPGYRHGRGPAMAFSEPGPFSDDWMGSYRQSIMHNRASGSSSEPRASSASAVGRFGFGMEPSTWAPPRDGRP